MLCRAALYLFLVSKITINFILNLSIPISRGNNYRNNYGKLIGNQTPNRLQMYRKRMNIK